MITINGLEIDVASYNDTHTISVANATIYVKDGKVTKVKTDHGTTTFIN